LICEVVDDVTVTDLMLGRSVPTNDHGGLWEANPGVRPRPTPIDTNANCGSDLLLDVPQALRLAGPATAALSSSMQSERLFLQSYSWVEPAGAAGAGWYHPPAAPHNLGRIPQWLGLAAIGYGVAFSGASASFSRR
jgi:hypothetical protein